MVKKDSKDHVMSVRFSDWEKRIVEKWARALGRDQSAAVREAALEQAYREQFEMAQPSWIEIRGTRYLPAGAVEDAPLPSTTFPPLRTRNALGLKSCAFWTYTP